MPNYALQSLFFCQFNILKALRFELQRFPLEGGKTLTGELELDNEKK